jgi:hypothetical protein
LVNDSRRGTRIVYALAPAADSPYLEAIYALLDRCCPQDGRMRGDIARFREALAAGTCRLEEPELDPAPPHGAQLQGNPA